MIGVHLKYMTRRSDTEPILMRQEQRLQAIHQLRDICHADFVGVTVEDIQRETGEHGIAHRVLLAEECFR